MPARDEFDLANRTKTFPPILEVATSGIPTRFAMPDLPQNNHILDVVAILAATVTVVAGQNPIRLDGESELIFSCAATNCHYLL